MLPVYVISLKGEADRRSAISDHLNARGFAFEFFDATDGRQMNVLDHSDYNGPRRRAAHGRDLKPGELGCLLSHRNLYQKIIDENLQHVFVVEDDARFLEDTKDVLNAFLKAEIDYDVVRLFGSEKVARGKHRKIIKLFKDFWLVRLRTSPGGTHAQLISQSGARKLLKNLESLSFPVDTVHGRCWETGVNSYSVQPGLSVQDLAFESLIGDDRFDKAVPFKGLEKIKFKITRAAFKINEALGKAWVYWSNASSDLAINKKFR